MTPSPDCATAGGDMVIVVQESSPLRAAIAAALRRDGHRVIELADGEQLLACLISEVVIQGERRDAIAVVTSPQSSVCPVLRLLRAARWRTPVVLVTDERERMAERDLGAVATLAPPLDPEALRVAVARALDRVEASGAERRA